MNVVFCVLCAFLLDLLLGDPPSLAPVHPVVWMGKAITALEALLRRLFPKTPGGERLAGAVLAFTLPAGTLLLSAGLLRLSGALWPPLAAALSVLWCWQALAAKDLRVEAMCVYDALQCGTLAGARAAVGRIVGRDTENLSAEGVARAAVETVAENFSDGVVAPLLFMVLGGAPLALAYKAVNTMDSMVGYKNARYLHFGRAAAKLDDAANFLPSRLAALLLIAAAFLDGADGKSAFRVWRRDRRNHASPNAAQCEAAMAGALGLQLCGPASYFGVLHQKPLIGDDTRPICPEDIRRSCRLEAIGSVLAAAAFLLIRMGVVLR